jgi:hypothetical protein
LKITNTTKYSARSKLSLYFEQLFWANLEIDSTAQQEGKCSNNKIINPNISKKLALSISLPIEEIEIFQKNNKCTQQL